MTVKYLVVNPYLTEIKDIESRLFPGKVPVNIVQPLGCNHNEYLHTDEADPASFQLSLTSGLLSKFIKEGHIKVVTEDDLKVEVKTSNIKEEKIEVKPKIKQDSNTDKHDLNVFDLNAFVKENNLSIDKIVDYLRKYLSDFMLKSDLDKQIRYAKVRLDGAEIIGDNKEIEFWSQKLNTLNNLNTLVTEKDQPAQTESIVKTVEEPKEFVLNDFLNLKYQDKLNFIKTTNNLEALDIVINTQGIPKTFIVTAVNRKKQLEK